MGHLIDKEKFRKKVKYIYFPIICILCCLEKVDSKKYFNQTQILVLSLYKMTANQIKYNRNRGLSIDFSGYKGQTMCNS